MAKSKHQSICFVSSTLSKGGAERALSNLLCNIKRENLTITVLLLNGIVTYPVPEDVKIIDLRKRSALYLPICFILLIYQLLKLKPDVLISVWSFPSLLVGLALKLTRLKTNWIVRVANNPANQEDDWRKKLFYWLYKHAKRYIVLCDDLKENFEEFYPYSKGKTRMIRNGFDIASLELKAGESLDDDFNLKQRYLVSVGSLTSQKRYDILLQAYSKLAPKYKIPLVILGDGPLKPELQKLASKLNIDDKVIFKGFVKNPYPYVANATIFLLNSDYEGLCNAAIEAQCLGIPAVITDCPTGNREIVVPNITGQLVQVQNPLAMTEGIQSILQLEENTYQQMKQQATRLVGSKYRIENSAKNLNDLISEFAKMEENQRFPNLFIVGAPKSGTTAMARHLVSHPDIYTPLQKEFTFFGKDLVRYVELTTKESYLSWFNDWKDEPYALDASPFYLYSYTAAQEFLNASPNSKIVIMLRNPVEVAYSMFFEAKYASREDVNSFDEAWNLESERIRGNHIPINARLEYTTRYQSIGLYSKHVQHYIDAFGRENVHVIIFDDFKNSNKDSYLKLIDFLGLPHVLPETFKVHNPSKISRLPLVTHFASAPPKWMGRVGSIFFSKSIRWKIRNFIKQKNTKTITKPPISPKMSAMLKEHFSEDIIKLEKILDVDLSAWK